MLINVIFKMLILHEVLHVHIKSVTLIVLINESQQLIYNFIIRQPFVFANGAI
jgi:hypothetical protein